MPFGLRPVVNVYKNRDYQLFPARGLFTAFETGGLTQTLALEGSHGRVSPFASVRRPFEVDWS